MIGHTCRRHWYFIVFGVYWWKIVVIMINWICLIIYLHYLIILYQTKLNPVPIVSAELAKWDLCSFYLVCQYMKQCLLTSVLWIKIAKLDNNKCFINLRFLQKANCKNTVWTRLDSQAWYYNLSTGHLKAMFKLLYF